MIGISADFSENVLVKYLGTEHSGLLPLFNENLLSYQKNYLCEFELKEIILYSENKLKNINTDLSVCNADTLFERLGKYENNETVVLYSADLYFETYFNECKKIFHTHKKEYAVFCLNDKFYCAFSTVGYMKKQLILHKSLGNWLKSISKGEYILNNDFADIITVNSVETYKKAVFQIMDGNNIKKPPKIANGIYAVSGLPKGDYTINPPVYLGENNQIENGAVIGPFCVLMSDNLISKDAVIENSIIMNNVYISRKSYIDGSICGDNSILRRGSALLNNSLLCGNAVVGEDCYIESNGIVDEGVVVDSLIKSPFSKSIINNFKKGVFYDVSPFEALNLGYTVGKYFESKTVAIASDFSPLCKSIKLSFISGVAYSGGKCDDFGVAFNSQIHYFCDFSCCDVAVFVENKNGLCNIRMYEGFSALSESKLYNMIHLYSKEDRLSNTANSGEIHQIKGLKKVYINTLSRIFKTKISFNVNIISDNPYIQHIGEIVLNKISDFSYSCEPLIFKINYRGNKVTATFENEEFSHIDLLSFLNYYFDNSTQKPRVFENINQSIYSLDGLFLCFELVEILRAENKPLSALGIKKSPAFFREYTVENTPYKIGEIIKILKSDKMAFSQDGEPEFSFDNGSVRLLSKRNNNAKFAINSHSFELCQDITSGIEEILKAERRELLDNTDK